MGNIENLAAIDQQTILHPFTNLHDYAAGKIGDPRIVAGGHGLRIADNAGREYLDAFAGLYCVNIGYGRQEVAAAIFEQAKKLAYYHTYAASSNEPLIHLSRRLLGWMPANMSKVFYGMSGSDANETQAKIVWYYNNTLGRPKKKKIISHERGYHGCTVISGSMTGMSFYHNMMDIPRDGFLRIGVPHHYWGAEPGESERDFSLRRGEELERLILSEGPETIGAFIGEPVLGTGGLIPPPEGYWQEIQRVLRKYDVLLIADEVICGFGRLGAPTGCHLYGIEPDLITVAKGLTSGYLPLSAAIVSGAVFEVLCDAADRIGAFSHGYTYSGHPLCAAAANANLDIIEREGIVDNAATVGRYLQERLQKAFAQHPLVGEVRGVGLLAAIEFVADRDKKRRFDPSHKVGPRVAAAALKHGLIARAMPHGDILGFAPPLVATREDVDEIVATSTRAIREVSDELAREGVAV